MTQPTNYRSALEQALDANQLTVLWDAGVKWRDAYTSAWKGERFKESEAHYRAIFIKAVSALTAGRAALAQPQEETCPTCGTHEIEFKRVCHNSACSDYATEITTYKGWNTHPQAREPAPSTADQCFCDENNLGVRGVSCGDCPRDYKQEPAQGEREQVISALQSALDSEFPLEDIGLGWVERAIALLQSTAQPVGELTGPVGYADQHQRMYSVKLAKQLELNIDEMDALFLAAAKAQPERKPLTQEECTALIDKNQDITHPMQIIRIIERAHGIG